MRARRAGPCFLECMTYRWHEHVGPGEDFHLGYRDRAEAEPWIDERPGARGSATLLDAGSARSGSRREVEAEIADAFAFAEASPFPDADAELLHRRLPGARR